MAEDLISVESSTADPVLSPAIHGDRNNVVLEDDNNDGSIPKKAKKKSINILKAALMLIRRRPKKSNAAAVEVASKGTWKRLVGSMRPLHLQSNQSPEHGAVAPPMLPPTAPAGLRASPSIENFEDVMSSPFSPNYVPRSPSSSVDGMSRYASAANLEELDQNEDESDKEVEEKNMNSGDDMIDAKAEMFIAKFYEQMRLQRSDSVVRYNEMIKRSIS